MQKIFLTSILFVLFLGSVASQKASIYEEMRVMKTYDFSQPDPVPNIGRIYPYFRFDGYSNEGIDKEWKMVVMENDYIKAYITPEIGGKIWGAIEKSTGNEFLYFNEVVKFRDIAMRGPWTSGGLEYNFGDIGHIPTASTPVDYVMKEYDDGSVACIVGALDLPSRTKWNVEIRMYPDKAFLETHVTWNNPTDLPVTYYHWMNAAARASGNLEFIYPGNARIGHNGEIGNFPIDNNRNISYYEKNNFGPYKSYHVLNAYSNFFGGYWHDDDFGFGHENRYDDKPGKKIWIWGLSDQGMIWEDLLTDTDGQYVEYQAGKLFNQASEGSTLTPFKHQEFNAHDQDRMTERWFPLKETGGMDAVSAYGVLKVNRQNGRIDLTLSALQPLNNTLLVFDGNEIIYEERVQLQPLEIHRGSFRLGPYDHFKVMLGDHLLNYSSDPNELYVDRPLQSEATFDWNTAYGIYLKGLEAEKQRKYLVAYHTYLECLELNPSFLPAINRLALSYYRMGQYPSCLDWIRKALAIDTYDGEANYIYGLVNEQLRDAADAKSGFSIATQHPTYRVAAYNGLARIYMRESNYPEALHYNEEALQFNISNTTALEIQAMAHRQMGDPTSLKEVLDQLEAIDATSTFVAHERSILTGEDNLSALITNELPHESYMELAMKYLKYWDRIQGIEVLKKIEDYPVAGLWMAYLYNDKTLLKHHLTSDINMVFPHRIESLIMLEHLMTMSDHWKLKYLAALIYWNKGRTSRAQSLFNECGNDPDLVAFYLARAELFGTDEEWNSSLQKALTIDPDHWRANLAFAERLINKKEFSKAENIATKFLNVNPAFGMVYARSLIGQDRPIAAMNFLSTYEILPYEGARAGRVLFHESAILSALQVWKSSDLDEAITYAEKARLWPSNLGSGKPYNPDERMEDFILWQSFKKKNNTSKAKQYANKLMEYPFQAENPSKNLLLQFIASDPQNRKGIIDALDPQKQGTMIDWMEALDKGGPYPTTPNEWGLIAHILSTIK